MDQIEDRKLRPLRNHDFRNQDLTGRNLSGYDLTGSQFDGSYGQRLDISGSDVTGTSWRGAEHIDMQADGIVSRGKLDMTGIMAPGLRAPGAVVEEWLVDVAELTDCKLDDARIGTLHARCADMRRGSAVGWQVGELVGELVRLPEVD